MKDFRMFDVHRILLVLTALLYSSCCNQQSSVAEIKTDSKQKYPLINDNGIYYWKTTFHFGEYEKEFLKKHNIKRLYIRLFDVDVDYEKNMPVPIATTRFMDSVPENIEVVPVVYITTKSLHQLGGYKEKFYKRIKAMAKRNGFEKIYEIQLDCDWTRTNQSEYFTFCQEIKELASKDNIDISATIRLHQLRGEAPPVDRGVLMLYNTGSIYDTATENSILCSKDVKPYLSKAIDYPLPLSMAYPTYSWSILMRNDKFVAILHETDFRNTNVYEHIQGNCYKVIKDHYVENKRLLKGDTIRLELSDMDEINEVRSIVNKQLKSPLSVIIYHLDSLNLSQYTEQEINGILK